MNARHAEWVEGYLARFQHPSHCLGRCREAAEEIAAAFPGELEVVRGHVHDAEWGKRGHWWCVDREGGIVDPTAAQFPALVEYEPYRDGEPVRVGTCMECGEAIWATPEEAESVGYFCGEACERAFACSLGAP